MNGPSAGAASAEKAPVAIRAEFTAPAPGKPAYLFITAAIESGWHIYSITQAPGGPIPAQIVVTPPQGVRVAGEFQASPPPERKDDAVFEMVVEEHHGAVTWYAPMEFDAGVDPAALRIRGTVKMQACSTSCEPLDLPFVAALGRGITIPASSQTPSSPSQGNLATGSNAAKAEPASGQSVGGSKPGSASTVEMPNNAVSLDIPTLLGQLLCAFLGGLLLNLMPCVLPVISLKVLSFLQQAGENRSRVLALNVWYSAGLLSVFLVLAALAATAGLAWGEQFTLPWFKVAMTAFVFSMAISFLGVWEIPIPGFVGAGRVNDLQTQEGPSGAFFKGVFTTVLATPCSGPFLGPVFAYLLKQPPYMAYLVFTAVGLGMASPYLVIGAFPQCLRLLPKPGAWMETVKQLMGFLLLGTVVYLFSTMTPRYFLPTLWLLVGLWFACWWIGRTPLTASPSQQFAAWLGGPLVAILVGWSAFTLGFGESKIAWQPFSPEALQQARESGKTVMVDFSADWCLTCKTNLKFSIETNAVRDLIQANGVVPMLADWTDHSPVIKKALNDLGRNAIPVLAIWVPQPAGKPLSSADSLDGQVILLSDLLTEAQVLDALKKAGPSKRR